MRIGHPFVFVGPFCYRTLALSRRPIINGLLYHLRYTGHTSGEENHRGPTDNGGKYPLEALKGHLRLLSSYQISQLGLTYSPIRILRIS